MKVPLAWVPRSAIVDALLASDTLQERALLLDERLTDILDDCEAVLVDIPHEWAKECVAAISALRAGFEGPAQSHAGNIIDSIVLRLHGRNGRDRAKARAGEPFDGIPLRLASESLALRPLYRAFVKWWPGQGDPPPEHFARHTTAHAVGHPGLFHRRHALVAVMFATSLTVQFWDDDVDAGPSGPSCARVAGRAGRWSTATYATGPSGRNAPPTWGCSGQGHQTRLRSQAEDRLE